MAGSFQGDDDEGITGINVVPLVDIMLVLLIIFMVTTQFVQDELRNRMPPNVEVKLPKAVSAQDSNPSLLSLVINSKGELYLDGKISNLAALKEKVQALQASGKKADAIIAADERVSHGSVVNVIDTLRVLGVVDVALNTKKQEIE
jgi:biopolymer transport protein TolR